jgi:hypothetical protein
MAAMFVVLVLLAVAAIFVLLAVNAAAFVVLLIGLLALCALVFAAVFDALALVRGTDTLGDSIRKSSRRYELYAAGIATFLGGLLGHFFWPTPG